MIKTLSDLFDELPDPNTITAGDSEKLRVIVMAADGEEFTVDYIEASWRDNRVVIYLNEKYD
jgi:hypothetical protein